MGSTRKFIPSLVALVLILGLGALASPLEAAVSADKVLAVVEGQEIKAGDVDKVITAMGPQGTMVYDNEQGRAAILDELIAVRLFALDGEKRGLADTASFKELMANFRTQALAKTDIDEALKDVKVSDADAKKFYDEHKDRFTTPEQIRVRHILLSGDNDAKAEVEEVQGKLKDGASFDAVAIEYSKDPGSAANGGDLGFFGKGQMVPEFEEAAFALEKPGDVSAPVKSAFGWHIIKLEEKKPAALTPYEDVKAQIIQFLTNEKKGEKYQSVLEELKKRYKVEKKADS
ncbi:MAG: peptidylprolyl isomerase [Synergistaceae bacterium]|nr:peptidylprolyl isomerase [Synergistaceae bacterium]